MKLYFAGAHFRGFYDAFKRAGGHRILISYFYFPKEILDGRTTVSAEFPNMELMIDSGAYTAFTQGVEINVKEYCDFLHRFNFDVYANLDDIKSWETTLQNQKIMEAEGLKPIPVWHIYEPHQVLEDYVKSYPYVALGFGPSKSGTEKARVASTIFEQFPDTKFHMFGLTQPELMIRYPFYSVDSSTWLNGSKYGALITPWGYVNVGQKLAREHWSEGRHYLAMERTEQVKWASYFRSCGFNVQDLLGTEYLIRAEYSIRYFLALEDAINQAELPKKSKKMLDGFLIQRLRRLLHG